MRLPIVGLVTALMLAGCGAQPAASIDGAWVRLPAVAGRPGAAYFTLKAGQQPMTLLSIRTPAAVRSELHESMKMGSGMMSMAPVRQVDVPANGTLAFAPGGKHAMLFDMNPALKAGGTTTLTLAFADGTTIAATAAVRGAGDPAP
jgi:copper(I)-binding protein